MCACGARKAKQTTQQKIRCRKPHIEQHGHSHSSPSSPRRAARSLLIAVVQILKHNVPVVLIMLPVLPVGGEKLLLAFPLWNSAEGQMRCRGTLAVNQELTVRILPSEPLGNSCELSRYNSASLSDTPSSNAADEIMSSHAAKVST